MVKRVILDCEKLNQRKQAHFYLAEMLDFPDYYGNNLDALFDCLTELGECTIVLEGASLCGDDGYGIKVLQVFREAAKENPKITLEEVKAVKETRE